MKDVAKVQPPTSARSCPICVSERVQNTTYAAGTGRGAGVAWIERGRGAGFALTGLRDAPICIPLPRRRDGMFDLMLGSWFCSHASTAL